jgi:hypothetical protein
MSPSISDWRRWREKLQGYWGSSHFGPIQARPAAIWEMQQLFHLLGSKPGPPHFPPIAVQLLPITPSGQRGCPSGPLTSAVWAVLPVPPCLVCPYRRSTQTSEGGETALSSPLYSARGWPTERLPEWRHQAPTSRHSSSSRQPTCGHPRLWFPAPLPPAALSLFLFFIRFFKTRGPVRWSEGESFVAHQLLLVYLPPATARGIPGACCGYHWPSKKLDPATIRSRTTLVSIPLTRAALSLRFDQVVTQRGYNGPPPRLPPLIWIASYPPSVKKRTSNETA